MGRPFKKSKNTTLGHFTRLAFTFFGIGLSLQASDQPFPLYTKIRELENLVKNMKVDASQNLRDASDLPVFNKFREIKNDLETYTGEQIENLDDGVTIKLGKVTSHYIAALRKLTHAYALAAHHPESPTHGYTFDRLDQFDVTVDSNIGTAAISDDESLLLSATHPSPSKIKFTVNEIERLELERDAITTYNSEINYIKLLQFDAARSSILNRWSVLRIGTIGPSQFPRIPVKMPHSLLSFKATRGGPYPQAVIDLPFFKSLHNSDFHEDFLARVEDIAKKVSDISFFQPSILNEIVSKALLNASEQESLVKEQEVSAFLEIENSLLHTASILNNYSLRSPHGDKIAKLGTILSQFGTAVKSKNKVPPSLITISKAAGTTATQIKSMRKEFSDARFPSSTLQILSRLETFFTDLAGPNFINFKPKDKQSVYAALVPFMDPALTLSNDAERELESLKINFFKKDDNSNALDGIEDLFDGAALRNPAEKEVKSNENKNQEVGSTLVFMTLNDTLQNIKNAFDTVNNTDTTKLEELVAPAEKSDWEQSGPQVVMVSTFYSDPKTTADEMAERVTLQVYRYKRAMVRAQLWGIFSTYDQKLRAKDKSKPTYLVKREEYDTIINQIYPLIESFPRSEEEQKRLRPDTFALLQNIKNQTTESVAPLFTNTYWTDRAKELREKRFDIALKFATLGVQAKGVADALRSAFPVDIREDDELKADATLQETLAGVPIQDTRVRRNFDPEMVPRTMDQIIGWMSMKLESKPYRSLNLDLKLQPQAQLHFKTFIEAVSKAAQMQAQSAGGKVSGINVAPVMYTAACKIMSEVEETARLAARGPLIIPNRSPIQNTITPSVSDNFGGYRPNTDFFGQNRRPIPALQKPGDFKFDNSPIKPGEFTRGKKRRKGPSTPAKPVPLEEELGEKLRIDSNAALCQSPDSPPLFQPTRSTYQVLDEVFQALGVIPEPWEKARAKAIDPFYPGNLCKPENAFAKKNVDLIRTGLDLFILATFQEMRALSSEVFLTRPTGTRKVNVGATYHEVYGRGSDMPIRTVKTVNTIEIPVTVLDQIYSESSGSKRVKSRYDRLKAFSKKINLEAAQRLITKSWADITVNDPGKAEAMLAADVYNKAAGANYNGFSLRYVDVDDGAALTMAVPILNLDGVKNTAFNKLFRSIPKLRSQITQFSATCKKFDEDIAKASKTWEEYIVSPDSWNGWAVQWGGIGMIVGMLAIGAIALAGISTAPFWAAFSIFGVALAPSFISFSIAQYWNEQIFIPQEIGFRLSLAKSYGVHKNLVHSGTARDDTESLDRGERSLLEISEVELEKKENEHWQTFHRYWRLPLELTANLVGLKFDLHFSAKALRAFSLIKVQRQLSRFTTLLNRPVTKEFLRNFWNKSFTGKAAMGDVDTYLAKLEIALKKLEDSAEAWITDYKQFAKDFHVKSKFIQKRLEQLKFRTALRALIHLDKEAGKWGRFFDRLSTLSLNTSTASLRETEILNLYKDFFLTHIRRADHPEFFEMMDLLFKEKISPIIELLTELKSTYAGRLTSLRTWEFDEAVETILKTRFPNPKVENFLRSRLSHPEVRSALLKALEEDATGTTKLAEFMERYIRATLHSEVEMTLLVSKFGRIPASAAAAGETPVWDLWISAYSFFGAYKNGVYGGLSERIIAIRNWFRRIGDALKASKNSAVLGVKGKAARIKDITSHSLQLQVFEALYRDPKIFNQVIDDILKGGVGLAGEEKFIAASGALRTAVESILSKIKATNPSAYPIAEEVLANDLAQMFYGLFVEAKTLLSKLEFELLSDNVIAARIYQQMKEAAAANTSYQGPLRSLFPDRPFASFMPWLLDDANRAAIFQAVALERHGQDGFKLLFNEFLRIRLQRVRELAGAIAENPSARVIVLPELKGGSTTQKLAAEAADRFFKDSNVLETSYHLANEAAAGSLTPTRVDELLKGIAEYGAQNSAGKSIWENVADFFRTFSEDILPILQRYSAQMPEGLDATTISKILIEIEAKLAGKGKLKVGNIFNIGLLQLKSLLKPNSKINDELLHLLLQNTLREQWVQLRGRPIALSDWPAVTPGATKTSTSKVSSEPPKTNADSPPSTGVKPPSSQAIPAEPAAGKPEAMPKTEPTRSLFVKTVIRAWIKDRPLKEYFRNAVAENLAGQARTAQELADKNKRRTALLLEGLDGFFERVENGLDATQKSEALTLRREITLASAVFFREPIKILEEARAGIIQKTIVKTILGDRIQNRVIRVLIASRKNSTLKDSQLLPEVQELVKAINDDLLLMKRAENADALSAGPVTKNLEQLFLKKINQLLSETGGSPSRAPGNEKQDPEFSNKGNAAQYLKPYYLHREIWKNSLDFDQKSNASF